MDTTILSIIDKDNSKVSDEANIRLLWAALLAGELVAASCEPVSIIYLVLTYDSLPEKQKFIAYLGMLKSNQKTKEEDIKVIENYYSKIVRSRSMKGKRKDHIVLLVKSEKQLAGFFNDFKSWTTNFCTLNKTAALLPLTCIDSDNWNKPLLAWRFPKEDTEKTIHQRIEVMADIITDSGWFPFHDSIVRQYFTSAEMNTLNYTSNANFIFDFLFEIPEPLSLTASQIYLVRNDINKASSKLFGEMKSLNEELKQVSFEKNNFEKIVFMYHQKIPHLKSSLQKTTAENSCFNELKSKNAENKGYRVHAGISSFTTIVDFYKELGIINASDALYIQEDMTSKVDINNCRLFLFLETADAPNKCVNSMNI